MEKFNLKIGFSNLDNDEIESIFDCDTPFIILKSEWKRALMLGLEMPPRTINDWWSDFVDLRYLVPVEGNEPQAWFQVNIIRRDIEEYYGEIATYLEAE